MIVLLIFTFKSCYSSKEMADVDKVITVDSLIEEVLFPEEVYDINIIPLETKSESIIGSIDQIFYAQNRFFIHCLRQRKILIFTEDGKYVNSIDRFGKGPEEYIELRDFKVDSIGNIYILSYNKILKYNLAGKFIKDIRLDFPAISKNRIFSTHFVIFNENNFFLWQGSTNLTNEDLDNHHALYHIIDNKLERAYFPVSRRILGNFQRFYKCGNYYNMQTITGEDLVYLITEKGVYPNFAVDFGKKNLPSDFYPRAIDNMGKIYHEVMSNKNYCSFINSIHETDQFILFAFVNGNIDYQALYNKSNSTVKVCKINQGSFYSSQIICTTDDGRFIGKIEPFDFVEQNKSASSNINVEANPILIVYKLKN